MKIIRYIIVFIMSVSLGLFGAGLRREREKSYLIEEKRWELLELFIQQYEEMYELKLKLLKKELQEAKQL